MLYAFTFSWLWAKEEIVENKETKGESAMSEQFIGKWEGNIETPNGQLPIIVDLQKNSGTLSVPAQGISNFPLKSVNYTGDQVSVSIHLNGSVIAINGTFKNEQIEATFQQNGGTFPLILQAYKEEPVTYETVKIPVQQGDLIVALQKPMRHLHHPSQLLSLALDRQIRMVIQF